MLVYRAVSDKELEVIMSKQKELMGAKHIGTRQQNTFAYNREQKYMHFFADKRHAELFAKQSSEPSTIVTFSIPKEILKEHISIGQYSDLYTNVKNKGAVVEFAIPIDRINPNWLWEQDKCSKKEIMKLTEESKKFNSEVVPQILKTAERKKPNAKLSDMSLF